MARSYYGKNTTQQQWQSKLRFLIGKAGSQQALANQYGVVDRTVRRWLTGESKPPKNIITKVNRSYGQYNREQPPIQGPGPIRGLALIPIDEWLEVADFSDDDSDGVRLRDSIQRYASEANIAYALIRKGKPNEAQLMTQTDIERNAYGKPAKTISTTLIGVTLVYPQYIQEEAVKYRASLLTFEYSKAWDFGQALSFMRKRFFEAAYVGKDGNNYFPNAAKPKRFVCYYLGGVK